MKTKILAIFKGKKMQQLRWKKRVNKEIMAQSYQQQQHKEECSGKDDRYEEGGKKCS